MGLLTTSSCDAAALSGISSAFAELFPSYRQVAYALLTRAPVYSGYCYPFLLDLHVLGTPPAFVLSQDQTLRCIFYIYSNIFFTTLNCLFFQKLAYFFLTSSYFFPKGFPLVTHFFKEHLYKTCMSYLRFLISVFNEHVLKNDRLKINTFFS